MNHNINFRHGPVMIMEGCGSEPYHMHRNANELIWVVEGEAGITFNNNEYILNTKDDLILIVDADFHKVRKISGELRYLSFYIDLPYFQKYIKDILNVGLYVNPGYKPPEQEPHLKKMRSLLVDIFQEYREDDSSRHLIDMTNQLLRLIRDHFNFLGTTSIDYQDQHTFNRMFGVYDFAYRHYTQRVSLSDLAEHLHVSQAYLSRSIKQTTGFSFTDILNYVRCEEASRLLLETDKNITTITYDCGFSDPKYFHQYFMKFFHASPQEFRKAHVSNAENYSLMDYQRPVDYDEVLAGVFDKHRDENEQYIPIRFSLPHNKTRNTADRELSVIVSEQDLGDSLRLTSLLGELKRDIVRFELSHWEEELHDCQQRRRSRAEELGEYLLTRRTRLTALPGSIDGLYTADGAKTPLYYVAREIAGSDAGQWEYTDFYAVSRITDSAQAGQTVRKLMLFAANDSTERNLEFRLIFDKGIDTSRTAISYTVSAGASETAGSVLFNLERGDLSEKRKKRLLDDICRPVCMAWHINEEWEEVPFKVGPGEITILIIE